MTRHVMLDTETWGVRPGCAIRSIGLVEFTLDGAIVEEVYSNISVESCEAVGLKVDPETKMWWARQPDAVQAALEPDQRSISVVLPKVFEWVESRQRPCVWAHGTDFDMPILTAAYEALKVRAPWKSGQVRDAMTVYDVMDFDIRDIDYPKEGRNALSRARYQAQCVVAALAKGRPAIKSVAPRGVFG